MFTRDFMASAALGLALLLAVGGTAGFAKDCKTSVTGNGSTKRLEISAKSSAKDAWRMAARQAYGSGYDNWIKSSGKNLTCGRASNRHWTCTAISQPCK